MAKINLLFVIQGLQMGGAEKMLINLVNNLDQSSFSSKIISLDKHNPLANQVTNRETLIIPLPRNWRYDLKPALEIRKIIIENSIDKIIAFDMYEYFFIWVALLNIHKKPKIFISIHNTSFRGIKSLLQKLIYARLISGRDQFISICNAQTNYWAKTYFISKKQFTTIYNGVDTQYFKPSKDLNYRNSVRLSLKIPENSIVIIQVARFHPYKRHEDSLMALKILLQMKPTQNYRLLLIGSGSKEREAELKELANKLEVTEQVIFCGSQQDVRPFYIASDLFTLTSRVETFSVAALEAMSMGLPCVLTDNGGAREMIVEGLNGRLVQGNNPTDIALGWSSIIDNLSQVDREKIRTYVIDHFSIFDCVEKYSSLLRSSTLID